MITLSSSVQETPLGRLFLTFLLLLPGPLWAAIEVEELRPLNFGTVAIVGNDSISTFTLSRSGIVNVDGDFLEVSRATPGRYQLSGFPPRTEIEIDVESATITAAGTGFPEPLILANYDKNALRSNEAGEAVLQLGASMSTNGNGGAYEDAPYEGVISVVFSWFEPQVGAFVSASREIIPVATVQTSLYLEEVNALDFGTVFAQAASGEQASLTLAPDGKLTTVSPGRARIGSVSPPQPGIIAVSGAAPRSQIQITPTSDPVLLQHRSPGAPHFILRSITTDPVGSGITDLDGRLMVRVGGTLETEDTDGNQLYPEGLYEGQYEMTIAY